MDPTGIWLLYATEKRCHTVLFLSKTMSCLLSPKSGTPSSVIHTLWNHSVKLQYMSLSVTVTISVSDGMNSMYRNPDSLLKRLYHRLACEDLLTHTLKCALHNLPQIYSVLTEQWTPDQVTSIHPNIFRRSVFLSTTLLVLLKWTESLITSSQPSHLSELSLSVNPDARLQPSLTLEVF